MIRRPPRSTRVSPRRQRQMCIRDRDFCSPCEFVHCCQSTRIPWVGSRVTSRNRADYTSGARLDQADGRNLCLCQLYPVCSNFRFPLWVATSFPTHILLQIKVPQRNGNVLCQKVSARNRDRDVPEGHRSQAEGTLTGHCWNNLSVKRAILNYKALKKIRKFRLATDW